MLTLKQITFASGLIFALLSTAVAQENSATVNTSTLTITAVASGEQVRITAPSSVVQMHVEIYAPNGAKLFDQEIRGGNVFDWHLQDGQAQRLAPGTYVCVVTAKSISGKLTQRIGTVKVAENSASVQPAELLSATQAQAIGPVEENSSWTIPGKDEPQTTTVIAHDGTDGQMIRGRGALSFRIGNFFGGIDKEQMRLTEEGNLGIGTSEPKAKLDVAGTIRAERVLIAKPKLASGDKTATDTLAADSGDSVQALASGTGTQNRIAKWTDNSGTLGDSSITETASNIGIGTTSPTSKLEVSGGYLTVGTSATNKIYVDADATGAYLQTSGVSPLRFFSGTSEVIRILNSGKIGIGTTSPASKLEVNGGYLTVGTSAANKIYIDADATGAYLQSSGTSPLRLYSGNTEAIKILNSGNVGIGVTNPQSKLDVLGDIAVSGNAVISGNIAAKYQDVAEWVPSRQEIAAGTVVILDVTQINAVSPSDRAYDTLIAGVVSAQPGVLLGKEGAGKVMVATTGRVMVKADASKYPIKVGDLLVTSNHPGEAMKSRPIRVGGKLIHRPGTIIGKALEPLPNGKGKILVLLSLQ